MFFDGKPTAFGAISLPVQRLHPHPGHQTSQANTSTGGNLAFSASATDDGRGHLTRRGTNAPFFTMSCLVGKPGARDVLERYQSCVALALDIDTIQKILGFHLHLPAPSIPPALYPIGEILSQTNSRTNPPLPDSPSTRRTPSPSSKDVLLTNRTTDVDNTSSKRSIPVAPFKYSALPLSALRFSNP